MTVCCRSNDLILGAYGANIVHFSMLQEYMAGKLGKMMGSLTQLSNSLHIYPDHKAAARILAAGPASDVNHYHSLKPLRLKSDTPGWDKKLENFFEVFDEHGPTEFLQLEEPGSFWEAAFTYWNAWLHYKHSPKDGLEYLQEVSDANLELRLKDWTFAMLEWLKRRVK